MKLMEVLVNLPIEELQQIAYQSGSSAFNHSKADLIRSIFEHLNDHIFVSCLLKKLSVQAKELLKLLMITESNSALAGTSKSGRTNPLKQYEKDKHFKLLKDNGLLYVINGQCQIPDELTARIMECLHSELYQDFIITPDPHLKINTTGMMLYYDIFHFLAFLSKNEVRLTQKDTIYSRTLHRLQRIMLTFNGYADHESSDEIFHKHNPFFMCILDFCLTTGLITKRGTRLFLSVKSEEWIQGTLVEQITSVLDFFRQRDEHLIQQWNQVIALLHTIEVDSWIDGDQFFQKINLMTPSSNSENNEPVDFTKLFVEPLHIMGLIDMGHVKEGDVVFRISPLGKSIMSRDCRSLHETSWEPIVIQPNFELLVPQSLPFSLRWQLESIADTLSVGNMITYSLSKESVIYGLKSGLSVENILTILKEFSHKQLPQNIEQTIVDWSEVYGQVHFVKGVLIHCKRPDIARVIVSIPALKSFIIKQITPLDLLIESKDLDKVRTLLETNEIIPVPDYADLRTVFSDMSESSSNSGIE